MNEADPSVEFYHISPDQGGISGPYATAHLAQMDVTDWMMQQGEVLIVRVVKKSKTEVTYSNTWSFV